MPAERLVPVVMRAPWPGLQLNEGDRIRLPRMLAGRLIAGGIARFDPQARPVRRGRATVSTPVRRSLLAGADD